MKADIAIIGMAGRFPDAASIRELYRVLRDGRDCVREVSKERVINSNLPLKAQRYKLLGWLEDVDKFDHKFFNITRREAEHMDPHQRLMLEVVHEALLNAGRSAEFFHNSRTSVIVGNAEYHYINHFEHFEPTMYSGNMPFSAPGRISREFQLRGPALMVDTGCSSGLMGVSTACSQLLSGDVDYALVVGAGIALEPPVVGQYYDGIDINSDDGKTRTFNADSKGSGGAEAVATLLLTTMDRALADDDHIHAVIKSVATNSSAHLASSLTATSRAAQAELLQEAWRQADLTAEAIDFIEVHGSGTKLGDPIEVQGIDQAFRASTDSKHICAVSCVKTNIGHTDQVAGLSGLIKAVLALQHKQHFPSLHFDKPNSFIDFDNSAVYVNTELRDWESADDRPRRAGVSSFGFAGHNAHVVLEEAPPRSADIPANQVTEQQAALLTFSSRYPQGLRANMQALADYLSEEAPPQLADISFTLNTGRQHFPYRSALVAADIPDLQTQLAEAIAAPLPEGGKAPELNKLIFVFSDCVAIPQALVESLRSRFPVFAASYQSCQPQLEADGDNASLRSLAFQYSWYKLLASCGINTQRVLGIGSGQIATRLIAEQISLDEALREAAQARPAATGDLQQRLKALVQRETEEEKVIFVEVGPEGALSAGLKELALPRRDELFAVCCVNPQAGESLLAFCRDLYEIGYSLDWPALHRHYPGRRVALPGYRFEKIRCWAREAYTEEQYNEWLRRLDEPATAQAEQQGWTSRVETTPLDETDIVPGWTPSEQKVALIWRQVLKIDELELDDDFFTLGGHSLLGTMVINRIQQEWDIKLVFKDIMMLSTVRTLARGIDGILNGQPGSAAQQAITAAATAEHYPLADAQLHLWRFYQSGVGAQLSQTQLLLLAIDGDLSRPQLEATFASLIRRQEILRSSIHELDGRPVLRVHPRVDFTVAYEERTGADVQQLVEALHQPFDLARAPLLRVTLVRVETQRHILVIGMDHLLFDGSSLQTLVSEFLALYQGQELPQPSLQYKDYVAWQRQRLASAELRRQEEYWLNELRGELPALDLPGDFERPSQRSFRGDVVKMLLGTQRLSRLHKFAQSNKSTLFMLLLATYKALLAKYSGQQDIIVGTPIAGRLHRDIENMIGMFANTLPIRTFPRGDKTFRGFLGEVRQACLNLYANQEYPIEKIIEQLAIKRSASRHPLFDVTMFMQNFDGGAPLSLDGITMTPLDYRPHTSRYDLNFEFHNTGADDLLLHIEYSSDLFSEESIQSIGRDFLALLDAILENPDIKLQDLATNYAVEFEQTAE